MVNSAEFQVSFDIRILGYRREKKANQIPTSKETRTSKWSDGDYSTFVLLVVGDFCLDFYALICSWMWWSSFLDLQLWFLGLGLQFIGESNKIVLVPVSVGFWEVELENGWWSGVQFILNFYIHRHLRQNLLRHLGFFTTVSWFPFEITNHPPLFLCWILGSPLIEISNHKLWLFQNSIPGSVFICFIQCFQGFQFFDWSI